MKNCLLWSLTVSAVLLGVAAPAGAQSLAEAARREAERRSTLTGPVKVYTSADLEGAVFKRGIPVDLASLKPASAVESTQAAPSPKPSPDAKGAQAEAPKVRDKRPEEHWRERAKLITDRLNRLRSDAAAVEGRVASLRLELDSAPPSQAAALANELNQAEQDLARFRVEIRLIQDEWTAFEEKARQAKIPLDWIR